jgi:hypothetical protein
MHGSAKAFAITLMRAAVEIQGLVLYLLPPVMTMFFPVIMSRLQGSWGLRSYPV